MDKVKILEKKIKLTHPTSSTKIKRAGYLGSVNTLGDKLIQTKLEFDSCTNDKHLKLVRYF